jgi:hypothetical protein
VAPVIKANAGGAVGARPAPASAEPASEWERRTKERLVRLTAQRILSHCPLPTRGRSLVAAFADADGAEPPWLEAPSLTVSAVELSWMQRAAPLLGETPRAVKRFANVYLLLRPLDRSRPRLDTAGRWPDRRAARTGHRAATAGGHGADHH